MNKWHWHERSEGNKGKYWHKYGHRIIQYRLHDDLKFRLHWNHYEARNKAKDKVSDRKYKSVAFKYTTI